MDRSGQIVDKGLADRQIERHADRRNGRFTRYVWSLGGERSEMAKVVGEAEA